LYVLPGWWSTVYPMRPKPAPITPQENDILESVYAEHRTYILRLCDEVRNGGIPVASVEDYHEVHYLINSIVRSLDDGTKDVIEKYPIAQQIELIKRHGQGFAQGVGECLDLMKPLARKKEVVEQAAETLRSMTGTGRDEIEGADEREIFAIDSLPRYHEFTILYRVNVVEGTSDTSSRILVDSCRGHRMLLEKCVGLTSFSEEMRRRQPGILNAPVKQVELVDKAHYHDTETLRDAYRLWEENTGKKSTLDTFAACLAVMSLLR